MPQSGLSTRADAVAVSDLIMEFLHAAGVDRIYGAPGTTELGLVHSAGRYGMEYHFVLHDTVAVGMADGFARASNTISVVNLHATQGLLNACGFIRVALRDNVPLLIIAGLPSTTYDIYEPNHFVLNLQQALTPITKWGWTVSNIRTLAKAFARAISTALSPPQGPTFIGLPQDVMEKPVASPVQEFQFDYLSPSCSVAAKENVERAAKVLTGASNVTLFAGYGAQKAVHWVETLADLVAAPIIAEALDRGPQVHHVYCSTEHPLFLGFFDARDWRIKECIARSDVLLFVGGKATYPKIIGELPQDCTVIQLNADAVEIGKYHRVDIPLVGHLELTLQALCHQVKMEIERGSLLEIMAEKKTSLVAEISPGRREKREALANVTMRGSPIAGEQLIRAMAESLPPEAIIVDDSQCMGYYLKHYYEFGRTGTLFGSMASHIGWALSASLGVKQARDSEPVVCLVGDCSFMFGLQALAAAARHHIPVLVIVANNRGTVSLKKEMAIKWKLGPKDEQTLSLNRPAFDYVLLAQSMGLSGKRVLDASDLDRTIRSGLQVVTEERRTCVIDVLMSDSWPDWGESWYVPQQRQHFNTDLTSERGEQ